LILDFLIFFIVYYIAFLSTYSYGKYFHNFLFVNNKEEKINHNEYIYLFYGVSFCILFSWLYYFSFGLKNEWLNLFFILFGFIIFCLDQNKTKKILFYFLPMFLFLGIIIYNNHNDFHLYHYQNIAELTDSYPKIGLGNLNAKYVYASIYTYFEAVFNFPVYKHHFFNIPRFLLLVSICGYLLFNVVNRNDNLKQFLSAVFLIFILIKFKRFSEYGYDYLVTFLIMFIFVEYFYKIKKKTYSLKNIFFLFAISVSVKLTALFFLPFIIYVIYRNFFFNQKFSFFLKEITPACLVALIFLSNSFLNSGCVLYPIKKTCFKNDHVSWSVNYDEILIEQNVTKKWAKAYYHQKNNKISSYEEYANNGKWLLNWFYSHFFDKIFEPILIFLSLVLIFYILCRSEKYKSKECCNFLLPCIASLFFWFISLPQLRFGYFYILLIIFLLTSFFLKKDINFGKKTELFIILAFIFFNIHNGKRIHKEFNDNKNFPWYEIVNFKTKQTILGNFTYTQFLRDDKNSKLQHSQNDTNFKYNLVFNDKNITLNKKNNFLFIKKND